MAKRILKILTSLRLTVVCLCFALVLVFAGTLAQVKAGLYATQEEYFKSFFVLWTLPGLGLRIPVLPGGYLLGSVLFINLVAAHLARFKMAKRKIGILMIHLGLIVLLLGQLLTDLLSVESAMRLQEGETKNYSESFRGSELVVTDRSNKEFDQVVSIPESYLNRGHVVTHPALPFRIRVRDYWRNCEVKRRPPLQTLEPRATRGLYTNVVVSIPEEKPAAGRGPAAALVEAISPEGSMGTWLVPSQSKQQQTLGSDAGVWHISLAYAPMLGGQTLILQPRTARGTEDMVTFSESQLHAKQPLHDSRLPFDLHVRRYWPHADLFDKPSEHAAVPEITQGNYRNVFVEPEPPVTAMDGRDLPAAVVELLDGPRSMGTWLLPVGYQARQTVHAMGKDYEIEFRFKRYYHPFSVTLLKATHEKYEGTDIPKNFTSRVRLRNPTTGEDREVRIYMNHPLRYAGLTFFQYQMAADEAFLRRGEIASSTFQVVYNPNWLTPYVACSLVGLGLLVQFLSHLIRFSKRKRSEAKPPHPKAKRGGSNAARQPRGRKHAHPSRPRRNAPASPALKR